MKDASRKRSNKHGSGTGDPTSGSAAATPAPDTRRLTPAPRHPQPIVLASTSPRRRELLEEMRVPFVVRASEFDEAKVAADHPRTFALRAAFGKARAVADAAADGEWILAADTVVTLRLMLFGKPKSPDEARWMLRQLSGKTHEVITAVALAKAGAADTMLQSVTTRVTFHELTDIEINAYTATDEPFDKAGAYAIQGAAESFIESIDGDYFNVVGLPCACVLGMLREALGAQPEWREPAVPGRWRSDGRRV